MTTEPATPLRIGLIGAGPWARWVHGPTIAGHPGLDLIGVWGRRPEAAAEVAAAVGTVAVGDLGALVERAEALVFCVPPAVQAELAQPAARAGKTLLLEKPLAAGLPGAQRLADACAEGGARTQMVLSWRYAAEVRGFLAEVGRADPLGGSGQFICGSVLGGPFATPWRVADGAFLDLAPHVIDLLDAALGPVETLRASGHPARTTGLLLEHRSGVTSTATINGRCAVEPGWSGAVVHTEAGAIQVDTATAVGLEAFTTVYDELLRTASGVPHALDVSRGLHLQRLLQQAAAQLEG